MQGYKRKSPTPSEDWKEKLLEGTSFPYAADAQAIQARGFRDYMSLVLKPDNSNRPIWVCSDGYVYLEMFLPVSRQASDFLVTMAEPICRPELIHEFQITVFSLYAGLSIGLSVEELLTNLNKFSKNVVPEELEKAIRKNSEVFGKTKLVLRDNKHWIESSEKEELDYLISNPIINAARRIRTEKIPQNVPNVFLSAPKENNGQELKEKQKDLSLSFERGGYVAVDAPVLSADGLAFKITEDDDTTTNMSSGVKKEFEDIGKSNGLEENTVNVKPAQHYSCELDSTLIEDVKRAALEQMHRPLVMEYDFRKDRNNPTLDIALKLSTNIRYYQERALRKMFSNGRARSGIIVLPCGAGKTLTGITACCTMRKSVIVLTTSGVAVDQWQKQFELFTTVNSTNIKSLTSDFKSDLWPNTQGGVLISTYTMLAYCGKRSEAAERIINQIKEREWGLLIFDEVQFAPAPAFRRVNATIRSHCKLGLTATLVREDDLIRDLQWLIGPKLYEANWLELQEKGYLAKAQCSEVWCPMTGEFYREYLRCTHAKQRKLWVCNPNKMMACEFLLKYHESRGDKVIVFSDNLFALDNAAKILRKPFISGSVSMGERMAIINKFKSDSTFNTLLLSKVGDNAIDIPCANVVIQISFNFASRRQEAQRLGRILRPKPRSGNHFNAFFYSLVSKDTQEMVYADKRQQFIIDQGYAYKVLHMNVLPLKNEKLLYRDIQIQKSVLAQILSSDDAVSDFEIIDGSLEMTEELRNFKEKRQGIIPEGLAGISGGLTKSSNSSHVGSSRQSNISGMHKMFKDYYTPKKK